MKKEKVLTSKDKLALDSKKRLEEDVYEPEPESNYCERCGRATSPDKLWTVGVPGGWNLSVCNKCIIAFD